MKISNTLNECDLSEATFVYAAFFPSFTSRRSELMTGRLGIVIESHTFVRDLLTETSNLIHTIAGF